MGERGRSKRFRRGVYPLFVKVLLVAVVLVVVLSLANYIYSLVISTKEYFELKPVLYITYSGLNPMPILSMYVRNDGVRSETVLRVEIVTGGGSYLCKEEVLIEAGFRGHITVADPSVEPPSGSAGDKVVRCSWEVSGTPELVGGHFYIVRLYTARHGIMTLNVLCQEA